VKAYAYLIDLSTATHKKFRKPFTAHNSNIRVWEECTANLFDEIINVLQLLMQNRIIVIIYDVHHTMSSFTPPNPALSNAALAI